MIKYQNLPRVSLALYFLQSLTSVHSVAQIKNFAIVVRDFEYIQYRLSGLHDFTDVLLNSLVHNWH